MYEIRGNSIRISNCSENITDASGDKKDLFYQTNFENEIHTINCDIIENEYYVSINHEMIEEKE